MSSLEGNKIIGAVLMAGCIAMTAGYASRIIVGGGASHGHHGAHAAVSYPLPEGADHHGDDKEEKTEEVVEEVAPLLASASVESGAKLFKKRCTACHVASEASANKTGPNLWGIVGRGIAADAGYSYGGLSDVADRGDWTAQNLSGFLTAPKKWAPGTKMNFKGLGKIADRANIISYLNQQSSAPVSFE